MCAQDVLGFIHPVTWRVFFKVSAEKKQAPDTFRFSILTQQLEIVFLNHLQTNSLVKVDNCHIFHSRTSLAHTKGEVEATGLVLALLLKRK